MLQEAKCSSFVKHEWMLILFSFLLDQKLFCENSFSSLYMTLSLTMFLKRFSTFAKAQPRVSYRNVSYKKKMCTYLLREENNG